MYVGAVAVALLRGCASSAGGTLEEDLDVSRLPRDQQCKEPDGEYHSPCRQRRRDVGEVKVFARDHGGGMKHGRAVLMKKKMTRFHSKYDFAVKFCNFDQNQPCTV